MGLGYRFTVVAGLVSLALGLFAPGATGSGDPSVNKDLAQVRRATAQFHSVSTAEAAGYSGTNEPCVEAPGLGAMGIHFVNPALIGDPAVDLEHPEIMLYVPSGNGLKRVGVEYLVFDADQDLSTDEDRPSLFGRGFDGPMTGHAPGMPVHYDLHVWTWHGNPSGTFAPFNPNLDCS